tara:strand:- start:5111 stop:6376 length:1266 start_codon:yes stop_codon:yes gene_type:complete
MKACIKTKVPGPKSTKLLNARSNVVAKGHGSISEVFIDKAKGANLIDVDGNIYIDFAGGIGSMNVGHAHPQIVKAIKNQSNKFIHPCFTVAPYEVYIKLAQRLCSLVPIENKCKAAFFNSGAEAVENAVKISKSFTGRGGVLVFSHAFHGRTQMTMSMTYKDDPYKKGFGPFVSNINRVEFPEKTLNMKLLKADPESISCLVIEPVAGEGGFIPVSKKAMLEIRTFCDDYGIVMVADEVQTGFGRTGSLFAMEQFGVEADLFTLAKSIAGGLPLSSVVGKSNIMDAAHVGGIGGTFGGNPIACAAALEVLDIMEVDRLPKRALKIGELVCKKIRNIMKLCPWIDKISGMGAMQGIKIVNPDNRKPDKDRTNRITNYALKNGLIMITAGTYGNVIRTLMPLTIKESELNQGLEILSDAIINA